MKNTGILLMGLSLLTLAMAIVLSKVAEAIFVISAVQMERVIPITVYILIAIDFLLGMVLVIKNRKIDGT